MWEFLTARIRSHLNQSLLSSLFTFHVPEIKCKVAVLSAMGRVISNDCTTALQ